mgnify:CR=1 FL=1
MMNFFKKKTRDFEVELLDIKFKAQSSENLLAAALKKGLKWPYRCKVGSCGTCKYQLIKGNIKPELDFSYVLDSDEIKEGFGLACQTTLKSDIHVKVDLLK